ncbi:TauD/TfdA family dioxygenase [Lentzea sp. NPDC055074]
MTSGLERAAALLADTARDLAGRGATTDRLWQDHAVPPELFAALAEHVRPPDRETGYRIVPGLLGGLVDLGPTPASWREAKVERGQAVDLAIVLVGSVLGRVFGWANQQDGRLVHDIVPSQGAERMQVGASSTVPLVWHTEDAFHPRRADLLLLACVRNPDGIGTDVASVRRTGLAPERLRLLGRRGVVIEPDDSYSWDQDGSGRGVATTWQADDGPCLRYDPSYSKVLDEDPEFMAAYDELGRALDGCGTTVYTSPGDILLVDNDISVHSRRSFRARYDGTDRWMKRTMIHLDRSRPADELTEHGYGQRLVELTGGAR